MSSQKDGKDLSKAKDKSQQTIKNSEDSQTKLLEFADQLKSLNLLQLAIIKNLQKTLSTANKG